MERKIALHDKPNLPRRLFWEFRFDDMDWRKEYLTVIPRVIERGNQDEWVEMIRFYGKTKVIQALKNEIIFLADYAIEEVCVYFSLSKDELLCYTRKQSRPQHWI